MADERYQQNSHRATQSCYSVLQNVASLRVRCAALLQRWHLSLQRCKRYTKSCALQRCGSCTTLPNVIQRYTMLSHHCQTFCNVVTKLCVVVSKLCNAAIVQRCATLLQGCQTLYNAVQRCNKAVQRSKMCNNDTLYPTL